RIHSRVALKDLLDRRVQLAAQLLHLCQLQTLEGLAPVALGIEHGQHDQRGQGEHEQRRPDRHPAIAHPCHGVYSTRSGTGRPAASGSTTVPGSVGKRATKRAPPPSTLSTATAAPKRSANSFTTANPMPAPRVRCVASVSDR